MAENKKYIKLLDALRAKNQIRVLFVCLGNICRSPAAEAVLLDIVERHGEAERWVIDSAGTGNYHVGDLADPRMRSHAARRGLRLLHRARQFQERDFDDFDLIIPMDNSNFRVLKAMAPTVEAEGKLIPMAEFLPGALFGQKMTPRDRLLSPIAGYDHVPDPYYEGAEGFELVLDMLQQGCSNLYQAATEGSTGS